MNGNPISSNNGDNLESLDARIKAAQSKYADDPREKEDHSALGMAWKLSTELVVSVLVGTGLGYGLDKLLNSSPWFMLIGIGFGFAAGIKSVLRVADKMDAQNAHLSIGDDMNDNDDDDEY